MNPHRNLSENETATMVRWLMGLLTCDMSGHTHSVVRDPFLIIEAGTQIQAEETYNGLVPLTSYYPCHPIACRREGGWSLCTDFMSSAELESVIRELTANPVCCNGE